MKISMDEVFAGLAMTVLAYFSYRVLGDSGLKKVKKTKLPKGYGFVDVNESNDSKVNLYDSDSGIITYSIKRSNDKNIMFSRCEGGKIGELSFVSAGVGVGKSSLAESEEHVKKQIKYFTNKVKANSCYGKLTENAYDAYPVH